MRAAQMTLFSLPVMHNQEKIMSNVNDNGRLALTAPPRVGFSRLRACIRTAVTCCLLALVSGGYSLYAEEITGRVTVILSGGAKIEADLLHRTHDRFILDLGHDVISIPRTQVLDVSSYEAEEAGVASTARHGIYSIGRLAAAPVSELVRRHGASIFMIRTPAGLGSGFFISEEGHLITNYHVIEGQTMITVTLFLPTQQGYERRELRRVRILALHPLRDLALLQIDKEELGSGHSIKPLVISSERNVGVGDPVFAVGNPLGLERSVTQGIVSSTTRTIGHLRFLQTDASINPGNSGGPILNTRGEVVGVVCAGATFFQGLAFGIPATDLVDFLNNWDAYLYNPFQPQNSITYLPPPFRAAVVEPEE
jgi:serine protease Do